MADRYWVGGNGTWDGSTTTNWSATSGGVSGASVPTMSDDVYFDSASSATGYTTTINCNVVATGSVFGSVLTISAITSGTFVVGQRIYVTLSKFFGGMTTAIISSFGTGTGGTGTYNLDISLPSANSRTIFGDIAVCKSITITAPATGSMSLAGNRPIITYGDISYPVSGLTVNYSGDYGLWTSDTRTITTNNIRLTSGRAVVIGTGTYNLATALTVGGDIFIQRGVLNSNNYNITTTTIVSESTTYGLGVINPGSSVLTLSTGIELNTSTAFQDATVTITGPYPNVINGSLDNPIKHLNLVNSTSAYLYTFGRPLRIVGTFYISPKTDISPGTLNGNVDVRIPITVDGEIVCVQPDSRFYLFELVDLTLNGTAILKNVVFRATNVTGASAPITGTNLGDAGGNTGVIFPSPKTVYWNLSGSQNWLSNGWAPVSGGTPDFANMPLPQDTCIFDDVGSAGTITFTSDRGCISAIVFINRTNPITFSVNTPRAFFCGNVLFSSAVTLTGTGDWVFRTFSVLQIISAGKTIPRPIQIESGSDGIVQLQDALTVSSSLALRQGIIDLNDFNLTASSFSSTGSLTRALVVGAGTLTITGAAFTVAGSNYATAGTGTISMASSASKTFAGGGAAYPKINQGGAGALTITGANSFLDITNTVQPATVTLPSSVTTNVQNFSLNGTVGNLITLNASTLGTRATINKTTGGAIFSPYLSIRDSAATPAQIWFAGTTSTNAGNNTGWVFADLAITTETATITDTNNATGTFNIAVTENETLTDVYTGQAVIPASRNESTALTSSTASQAVFALSQTDTQTVSDSSTGNAEYPNIATESLTMSDSMQTTISMQVTVDESTTLTESQSAIFFFAGVVAELMQVSETQTSIAVYTNAHNESITITDQQTSFGWFTINTIQNPNWTVINDTQV